VWNEIVTDSATSAETSAETSADTERAPEPRAVQDGRPWPAPSPDAGWWRGEPAGSTGTRPVPRRPLPTPARRPTAKPLPPVAEAPTPVAADTAEAAPAAESPGQFPLWPKSTDAAWPAPQPRTGRLSQTRAPRRPTTVRRARATRRPAAGLPALVVLALLAGFLAWTSADAFWLAVGHGRTGTATVSRCAGSGLTSRCTGTFTGGGFTATRVALAGLPVAARQPGARFPAEMASARGRVAYAGRAHDPRWALGFGLIVLCGLAIAWATGAGRLPGTRARLAAYAVSFAGPLLLLAGALAATW
jgi:hypothetical protein